MNRSRGIAYLSIQQSRKNLSLFSNSAKIPLHMSNTELERRLAQSHLHEEDAEEVRRIFDCLKPERQMAILQDWFQIEARMIARRERMEAERLVLILDPLEKISQIYDEHLRFLYKKEAHTGIQNLQTNI